MNYVISSFFANDTASALVYTYLHALSPHYALPIFSVAVDSAIGAHAPVLNRWADLFGYNDPRPPGTEAPDWRRTVRSILTLARANGLAADDLAQSAARDRKSVG